MTRIFLIKGLLSRIRSRRVNRRAVQEFSRSLALIVDREALESSVAVRIRELFNPDRLALLRPDDARALFAPSFSLGLATPELDGVSLSCRGKLARWLTVNETCLLLDRQPGVFEYLEPGERALFTRLRLTVCVPLISLNRLTGLLLLGADDPGWSVTKSDVELLQILAGQVSLAFENADLYREQRERLDRLYRAERLASVGQLAAGVAHEIRNPLTAIRSTIQYLLQGARDEPRRELIAEVLSEVDRINGTIGSLLSLSRTGDFRLAEIDLLEPLERALTLVQAQAVERRVEVELRLRLEDRRVMGDPGPLRQVFLNLLLNALQAMVEGGRIRVEVAAWAPRPAAGSPDEEDTDGGRRWVEVRIADSGPGIDAETLRRIFDPFFTTKAEGTGLGLAISHSIVAQHQGEVQIESEPGKGTSASVRLPLV